MGANYTIITPSKLRGLDIDRAQAYMPKQLDQWNGSLEIMVIVGGAWTPEKLRTLADWLELYGADDTGVMADYDWQENKGAKAAAHPAYVEDDIYTFKK